MLWYTFRMLVTLASSLVPGEVPTRHNCANAWRSARPVHSAHSNWYRDSLFEKYADHYSDCILHICSYGGDRYLPPTSEVFGAFGLLKATAADVICWSSVPVALALSLPSFSQSFIVGSTPCSSLLHLALLLSPLVTCVRGDASRPPIAYWFSSRGAARRQRDNRTGTIIFSLSCGRRDAQSYRR